MSLSLKLVLAGKNLTRNESLSGFFNGGKINYFVLLKGDIIRLIGHVVLHNV